jgi:hypothetical protein
LPSITCSLVTPLACILSNDDMSTKVAFQK